MQSKPTQRTEKEKDRTDAEVQKGKTKGDRVNCNRFQTPQGLVPRILYGLRGRKLIRLLLENAQVSGRKLGLVWLNIPRAFEGQRVVSEAVQEDSEEGG